jgi:hypothetical protein
MRVAYESWPVRRRVLGFEFRVLSFALIRACARITQNSNSRARRPCYEQQSLRFLRDSADGLLVEQSQVLMN